MAIGRKQVRSIVVLVPKGRFYGDKETDDLDKAILNEATAIRNAGAAGQMIGRNAFQRSREAALDLFEQLVRVYRGAD